MKNLSSILHTTWKTVLLLTVSPLIFSNNKYQSDVDQFWLADWQTPSVSDYCTQKHFLPHHLFFCVTELNNAGITVQEFFNNCSEWQSLAWQLASLSSWAWQFLHIVISQGSVARHSSVVGYLTMSLFQIYYWVCQWKKIGQHLTKLLARVKWFSFFDSQCI